MDLKKIKSIIFDDIELVLSNLEMDYETIGDNINSTCPVHEGSDNHRAFSLSTDKQIWRCWTRDCQESYGNDIFGLTQGILSNKTGKNAGFREALLHLCNILNIDSKSVKITKAEEPSDFVKLVDIFSHNSTPNPQINPSVANPDRYNVVQPSEYFICRGFKESTLLEFEVGDCIDRSSSMYQRSIIPIHNGDGSQVVAHIGRSTKEYRKPKFLFTKGFDKRYFLYNYHRAISKAIEKSCLFITEGQGDVWKLFEAGVHNAVSIFGKSLSMQQKDKLIQSGITTLVILTDNDQAGRESKTELQRQLGRMFNLVFPRMSHKDIGDMREDKIRLDILPQVEDRF